MNLEILHTDVQHFINQHLNSDISKLILKGSPFKTISIQELAEQIEAKKRCKNKLPSWFNTKKIYYPNKLNIEQTSSEITANYKAALITGNSILDLTGGFGVDTIYFSKQCKETTYCEVNPKLFQIATYNFKQLNSNIGSINSDGLEYLKIDLKQFDWIYIDPSRRNANKEKVFLLDDCTPNIPENIDLLFEHTNNIMIKVSPMLDISSVINELKLVKEVHVIAVENEVKELLFILKKGFQQPIQVKTVNIKKEEIVAFDAVINSKALASFSEPLSYLYEPNSAILKASLFNEVSNHLKTYKLHNNSHLYTSLNLIEFPGRRFKVKHQLPYDKKQLKKLIPEKKANITTRNFPETVLQIRKKTGIKEGGDLYLFFTTNKHNKHIVLICEKVY